MAVMPACHLPAMGHRRHRRHNMVILTDPRIRKALLPRKAILPRLMALVITTGVALATTTAYSVSHFPWIHAPTLIFLRRMYGILRRSCLSVPAHSRLQQWRQHRHRHRCYSHCHCCSLPGYPTLCPLRSERFCRRHRLVQVECQRPHGYQVFGPYPLQ
jgi:hypothetical protein